MGKSPNNRNYVYWSEAEVEVVREHYRHAEKRFLLELLPNRTFRQIGDKAHDLGVYRYKPAPRTADETRAAKRLQMATRRAQDLGAARKSGREHYHRRHEANLATMKAYQRRRFFWRRAVKLKGVSARDLAGLWKRQRGRCAITDRKLDRTAQVDHILPQARGGTDSLANLRWVCALINIAKRHMTDDELEALCADMMSWVGERIGKRIQEVEAL